MKTTKFELERPNACRLYSVLGQILWLHAATGSTTTDEQKLDALRTAMSNLEQEVGVRRLSFIQDEIYYSL
jgi:hypothetical protein